MPNTATILMLLSALAVTPAAAQDPMPGDLPGPEDGFTLVPAEGEHLMMDRRSGRVSLCRSDAGRWRCSLVPDDRRAYEEELDALRAENERLEDRIADLEDELAMRDENTRLFGPEDEEKIDEFFDFADRAFRRFFGMVEDLKRDYETPDRT